MTRFFFEDTPAFSLNQGTLSDWIDEVSFNQKKEVGQLNVVFVSDGYLLEMNKEHLNHDYYTDILTFDYSDQKTISGDLFISIDRVRENAAGLNIDFVVELRRVIIHGVLHLLGYKDKSKEEKLIIREKENWALSLIVSRETKL